MTSQIPAAAFDAYTDKGVHGYLPTYQQIADELGPTANVCEVGVWQGGSLQM